MNFRLDIEVAPDSVVLQPAVAGDGWCHRRRVGRIDPCSAVRRPYL